MSGRNKPSGSIVFAAGVASVSLLIGLLTGASPSPVAGTVISAALGLLMAGLTAAASGETGKLKEAVVRSLRRSPPEAVAATLQDLRIDLDSEKDSATRKAGALLLLVAVTVAAGIVLGSLLRIHHIPSRAATELSLPWKGSSPPTITFNAVDWLVLQQALVERGYTTDQVASLYRIQLKEWSKSGEQPPQDGLIVKYRPLSDLVKGAPDKSDDPSGFVTDSGFKLPGTDG